MTLRPLEEKAEFRRQFVELAEQRLQTLEQQVVAARQHLLAGVDAFNETQDVVDQMHQGHVAFKDNPVFLESRKSVGSLPSEHFVADLARELRIQSAEFFDEGMRICSRIGELEDALLGILQEHAFLVDQQQVGGLDEEGCLAKVSELSE